MRRHRLLAALVAVAGLLTACSTPLPVPAPDAVPAATPPALSAKQAERIIADVAEALAAADAEFSKEALSPRVTGPAAEMRDVEYRLAVAGDADALTVIPAEVQTLVLPTTDEWPRTLMAITEPPQDLQAPLLLTFVQSEPRAQYQLWSWARLFPGVQTPALAQPEVGSAQVADDAANLVASPTVVLQRYVDVLTNRDQSQFAAQFAADPMSGAIWQTKDAFVGLVGANGTLTEIYEPATTGVRSVATADGGALVVGTVKTTTTIALVDSTLKIGDQTAVLLGTDTVQGSLVITWSSIVVFAVPPAGSDAQIQVLGGEHDRVAVAGQ